MGYLPGGARIIRNARGFERLPSLQGSPGKARGKTMAGSNFLLVFGKLRRLLFFALLLFVILGTLGAGNMKAGKQMEIVGKIYVMGNEPFTKVAIKLDDGQVYALLGEYDRELRKLQGKRVSVTGEPSEERPRGANAIVVRSFKVVD